MTSLTTSGILKQRFPHQEAELLSRITAILSPAYVYLLSTSKLHRTTESIFQQDIPEVCQEAGYIVLILITEGGNRKLYEWQDMIEQRCRDSVSLTAIVLEVTTFSQWATGNHPFARRVLETAPVIYCNSDIQFYFPGEFDNDEANKAGQQSYRDGLKKAKEFMAGAELFYLRNQPNLSVFMLHQAAEQALSALIKYQTDYYETTHSLDKLIRYAATASSQVHEIVPRRTDKERRLFNLLKDAYSVARYEKDYSIQLADLNVIMEKVRRMIELLASVQ